MTEVKQVNVMLMDGSHTWFEVTAPDAFTQDGDLAVVVEGSRSYYYPLCNVACISTPADTRGAK
jgi:hypothetical protein